MIRDAPGERRADFRESGLFPKQSCRRDTSCEAAVAYLLWMFARVALSLRYRIRVHGLENVRNLSGPILVLPNHPAYIDPPIVLSTLYPGSASPAAALRRELPEPGPVSGDAPLLDALRVPDLDQTSEEVRKRTEGGHQPASRSRFAVGRMSSSGHRAGSSGLRWSGLGGCSNRFRSASGRAASEDRPGEDARAVGQPLQLWVERAKAGLPQAGVSGHRLRPVQPDLLLASASSGPHSGAHHRSRERLPGLEREVLNPWLEKWYNAEGPEKPIFVPAHFLFGPRSREFPRPKQEEVLDLTKVKPATRQAVNEMVADKLGRPIPEGDLKPETPLEQLGMDSLDRMELSLAIERRFGFSGAVVPNSLGQLYALASGLVPREPPKPPPPLWFQRPADDESTVSILGDTIAEAFVARALANRKDVVTADDRAGVLTYERLLVGRVEHGQALPRNCPATTSGC